MRQLLKLLKKDTVPGRQNAILDDVERGEQEWASGTTKKLF